MAVCVELIRGRDRPPCQQSFVSVLPNRSILQQKREKHLCDKRVKQGSLMLGPEEIKQPWP